jgi:uncharacterized protein (DUF1330 family)
MSAYLIVDLDVKDPQAFERYRREVPAVIEKYGGRYLVRGGACDTLEGEWTPKRVVVLEFPTMAALKRWYHSEDYRPLLQQRLAGASADVIAVDGI